MIPFQLRTKALKSWQENEGLPKLLVCGGRAYSQKDAYILVRDALDKICEHHNWKTPPTVEGNYLYAVKVVSGGAKGIDTAAIDWAIVNWCNFVEFTARWEQHGRAAGAIRNQQMLDEAKPDYVVAFPGGKGTADMVRRAQKVNVPIIKVDAAGNVSYPIPAEDSTQQELPFGN